MKANYIAIKNKNIKNKYGKHKKTLNFKQI